MSWNNQPPQQPNSPQWGQSPMPAGPPLKDPSQRPAWARKRVLIPAALVLLFVGVGIGTSDGGDAKSVSDAKVAPAVTVTTTATASAKAQPPAKMESSSDDSAESAAVPDFVGSQLQAAQDDAQAQGFYLLKSHDETGAGRFQVLDRNWQVCSQNYLAGKTIPVDSVLDFGAVKLEESCP